MSKDQPKPIPNAAHELLMLRVALNQFSVEFMERNHETSTYEVLQIFDEIVSAAVDIVDQGKTLCVTVGTWGLPLFPDIDKNDRFTVTTNLKSAHPRLRRETKARPRP